MSAGFVHVKASLILAAGFSVGALVSQDPGLLECAFGSLTGIVVGPDADVDAGNISNKIVKQKVGWFGERIWRLFWRWYSGSFKHGRFASHFPIFSTFVRLAYIYFVVIVPFYTVYFLAVESAGYHIRVWHELSWWALVFLRPMFFYGLCSSDLIHFFLDILTKEKSNH